jgi:hypothetical protein
MPSSSGGYGVKDEITRVLMKHSGTLIQRHSVTSLQESKDSIQEKLILFQDRSSVVYREIFSEGTKPA